MGENLLFFKIMLFRKAILENFLTGYINVKLLYT